jgi:hypothetical protein
MCRSGVRFPKAASRSLPGAAATAGERVQRDLADARGQGVQQHRAYSLGSPRLALGFARAQRLADLVKDLGGPQRRNARNLSSHTVECLQHVLLAA